MTWGRATGYPNMKAAEYISGPSWGHTLLGVVSIQRVFKAVRPEELTRNVDNSEGSTDVTTQLMSLRKSLQIFEKA